MPASAKIPLSDHLKKVPAAVRPTVAAAIKAVKEVAPTAEEIPYRSQPPRSNRAMWKLVRYAVDGVYVVGKNKRYHVTGVRVHPRPVKAKSTAVKIKPTTAP